MEVCLYHRHSQELVRGPWRPVCGLAFQYSIEVCMIAGTGWWREGEGGFGVLRRPVMIGMMIMW